MAEWKEQTTKEKKMIINKTEEENVWETTMKNYNIEIPIYGIHSVKFIEVNISISAYYFNRIIKDMRLLSTYYYCSNINRIVIYT